jgi:hypothetical protein
MKKFNISDIIAAATATYFIVKMASSLASRRRSAKAIVGHGAQIVAATRHDLRVSPG